MKRPLHAIALFALAVLVAISLTDFSKTTRRVPGPASDAARADRVVVEKGARRLRLMKGDRILRDYAVTLGSSPTGNKQQEGDGRTPEGLYRIDLKNPQSAFHLSLRVSYPDDADRAEALARNVPPGGDIMIHGLPNGLGFLGPLHRLLDWTDGCVAVTNHEIEEIWAMTEVGTAVEISR